MQLTPDVACAMRLRALLLDPSVPSSARVRDVVDWFGAMQSQDLGSGLWSLGTRLPGTTVA